MVSEFSLCIEDLISHWMEPMFPTNNSSSAGRFPMYLSVHFRSGLLPPCLRFAAARYRTPRKTRFTAAG